MWAIQLLIFLAGTAVAVAIGLRAYRVEPRHHINPTLLVLAVVVWVGAVSLVSAFGQVPAGYRGVVLRFGAPTGQVLDPGLFAIMPAVTSVAIMSIQTEAYETDAAAASSDLQDVHTKVTLNFALDPAAVVTVYQNLRHDYIARIVKPAIQEAVKAATAEYTAEELITKRPAVRDRIERILEQRLSKFGIAAQALSITDFEFSKSFNDAIEAKVTAQQRALEAQRTLERVKFEAQQRIEQAKAQAEGLRLQQAVVTPELIQLRRVEALLAAIEKWDGKMPTVVTGSGPVPLLDVFRQP